MNSGHGVSRCDTAERHTAALLAMSGAADLHGARQFFVRLLRSFHMNQLSLPDSALPTEPTAADFALFEAIISLATRAKDAISDGELTRDNGDQQLWDGGVMPYDDIWVLGGLSAQRSQFGVPARAGACYGGAPVRLRAVVRCPKISRTRPPCGCD